MRILFTLLILVLLIGLSGFLLSNSSTHVPVTMWNTHYPAVPVFSLVLGAVLIGVVFTGIFAVAEGAKIRLENRRLRRQLHQLETEVNYLRTQPSSSPRKPPEVLGPVPQAKPLPAADAGGFEPPSAPVYGTEPDDWSGDTDDDAYSGGRAV